MPPVLHPPPCPAPRLHARPPQFQFIQPMAVWRIGGAVAQCVAVDNQARCLDVGTIWESLTRGDQIMYTAPSWRGLLLGSFEGAWRIEVVRQAALSCAIVRGL